MIWTTTDNWNVIFFFLDLLQMDYVICSHSRKYALRSHGCCNIQLQETPRLLTHILRAPNFLTNLKDPGLGSHMIFY
ncbi:hypothetical protein LOD99_13780 [Oopsacas minuta]|uniref:Uncharacterized protein n=1 Tax=Oopsacas minuta TaxID=111878 RepID=A0AAV7KJS5_9METZ|nr:hypothetical protein LOD99_13780 [Oopsacas minuta]